MPGVSRPGMRVGVGRWGLRPTTCCAAVSQQRYRPQRSLMGATCQPDGHEAGAGHGHGLQQAWPANQPDGAQGACTASSGWSPSLGMRGGDS